MGLLLARCFFVAGPEFCSLKHGSQRPVILNPEPPVSRNSCCFRVMSLKHSAHLREQLQHICFSFNVVFSCPLQRGCRSWLSNSFSLQRGFHSPHRQQSATSSVSAWYAQVWTMGIWLWFIFVFFYCAAVSLHVFNLWELLLIQLVFIFFDTKNTLDIRLGLYIIWALYSFIKAWTLKKNTEFVSLRRDKPL